MLKLIGVFVFVTSLSVIYPWRKKSASAINKITTFAAPVRRYDRCMKDYILAIFPKEFRRNKAYWRAFVLGLIMVALALLQLFQFEDFPRVFEIMRLPGGSVTAVVLAAAFPLLEAASLPFLFSMRVPDWLRKVSAIACIAVGALWLFITLWASITHGSSIVSGIFGATLNVTSGWLSVLFAGLLVWSAVLTVKELPKRR